MAKRVPAWYREIEQARKDRDKLERRNTRYGVFIWDGRNFYHPKDAVKVYKREQPAWDYAKENADRNYVVRSFTVEGDNE